MIEQQRLVMAKKEAKYQEEAELLTQELTQLHLMISRKSGETGTLFGSVTSKDIADLLKTTGVQMDRRKIVLHQPIKNIGNYKIEVRPHSEVTAELLLSVLLEGDEPVNTIKKKDEQSDAIVAELEAKLKEMKQSAGGDTAPQSEDLPAEEEAKSPQPEAEPEPEPEDKEATAAAVTEEEVQEQPSEEAEKEETEGQEEEEKK